MFFLDNIIFLLESFRAGDRSGSKSIIMVLDRFDLFCTHTNQTLLYNLFDAVQSQQVIIIKKHFLNIFNFTKLKFNFFFSESHMYYWYDLSY